MKITVFWKLFLLKFLVSSALSLEKGLREGREGVEGTLKFLWSYYSQPCDFRAWFGFVIEKALA